MPPHGSGPMWIAIPYIAVDFHHLLLAGFIPAHPILRRIFPVSLSGSWAQPWTDTCRIAPPTLSYSHNGDLICTAGSLRSTVESMATPCSVKASGAKLTFRLDVVTDCDRIPADSCGVSSNIISSGNRSLFPIPFHCLIQRAGSWLQGKIRPCFSCCPALRFKLLHHRAL
jgi:hypothetical protein